MLVPCTDTLRAMPLVAEFITRPDVKQASLTEGRRRPDDFAYLHPATPTPSPGYQPAREAQCQVVPSVNKLQLKIST
ncbi:hypothetical protein [Dokdonella immobilis]|uniref:hypothetical protein n=1 Tax=Dokdonella immobilis TaxID=578942 RepID=UPI0015873F67|nr:hypothetical protein [Dokdonella immobilis]